MPSQTRWAGLFLLAAFLLAGALTTPEYIGDTERYVYDALRHQNGLGGQFWEFGHLLWRPWAYVGLKVAAGGAPVEGAIRFLMATCWICAAASLLLAWRFLSAMTPGWAALAATLGLLVSNPFLNYSRSGAPYIPALCFLLLTLDLLLRSIEARRGSLVLAAFAGGCFAVCFGLWFPFGLAAPGAIALVLLWNRGPEPGRRWRILAAFGGAAGALALVVFGLGARAYGAQNLSDVARWIQESKNDWQQSITVARLATGLPRSIYELGADGLLLKRRVLNDPYNPVPLTALIPVVLKTGWFFLTGGLAALTLLRAKDQRRTLLITAAGLLPLLFFSVVLFEPGSPERFLPAFPFIFLACATVLGRWPRNRAAAAAVGLLFATAAVSNLWALNWNASARRKEAVIARKRLLERYAAAPHAFVFVPSFRDDFYRLPDSRPLDPDLKMPRFRTFEVIEPASTLVPFWKARFALRALAVWHGGGEVWLSDRLFAGRPEAAWEWTEGDDRRVRWADMPAFFGQLEIERAAGDSADGFVRVPPSAANRARLEALASLFPDGELKKRELSALAAEASWHAPAGN